MSAHVSHKLSELPVADPPCPIKGQAQIVLGGLGFRVQRSVCQNTATPEQFRLRGLSNTVDGRNPAPPTKPWNADSRVNTNGFKVVRNGFRPSTVWQKSCHPNAPRNALENRWGPRAQLNQQSLPLDAQETLTKPDHCDALYCLVVLFST